MVQDINAEVLLSAAENSRKSLDSLSQLLETADNLGKSGSVHPDEISRIQRQVLLDSFTVKKFHRDYKEWQQDTKEQFIQQEVKSYNKKYAQMSRLYQDFEKSEASFEEIRKSTKIPAFDFSIQTIQQFENGILLDRVPKGADGQYPNKVALSQLFSLDSDSNLPSPSFPVFNRLVNLEYRLRMLLQIKHEVLLKAKAHLAAKNSQWASRDAKLNSFLTRDFAVVHEEIKKIKASEYEDLKYYEEDFEDEEIEDEIEDEIEQEIEDEENEIEENGHDEGIEENKEIEEIDENREIEEIDDIPEKDLINAEKDTDMENEEHVLSENDLLNDDGENDVIETEDIEHAVEDPDIGSSKNSPSENLENLLDDDLHDPLLGDSGSATGEKEDMELD